MPGGFGEGDPPPPPLLLGLVQRLVGPSQELFGATQAVPLGDADGTASGGHGLSQALGDSRAHLQRAPGQEHGELVATHPAEHVADAQDGLPGRCDILQQEITGLMPVAVVVSLEVVEADDRDRDRHPFLFGPRQRSRELLVTPRGTSPSPPRRFAAPVSGSVPASSRSRLVWLRSWVKNRLRTKPIEPPIETMAMARTHSWSVVPWESGGRVRAAAAP